MWLKDTALRAIPPPIPACAPAPPAHAAVSAVVPAASAAVAPSPSALIKSRRPRDPSRYAARSLAVWDFMPALQKPQDPKIQAAVAGLYARFARVAHVFVGKPMGGQHQMLIPSVPLCVSVVKLFSSGLHLTKI